MNLDMQRNHFYQLGLSALSEKDNCHIGAIILGLQRTKEYLRESETPSQFIDSQILSFANSHQVEIPEPLEFISTDEAKQMVSKAMLKTCHRLHFIAHDLISGTYALIALNEITGEIDKRIVNRICLNIENFIDAPPGYFYKQSFDEIIEAENSFIPSIDILTEQELVYIAISFLKSIKTTYLTWFFRSQEVHVITHTHALVWLKRNGFENVFYASIKPWLLRMALLENIIDPNDSELVAAPFEPFKIGTEDFWKKANNDQYDGHIFKTTFSVLDLRKFNLLSQTDLEYLFDSKFPYLFSSENNQVITS